MELKHEGEVFYFGDSMSDYVAKMETTRIDDVLNITHTEVSEAFKGQGMGRKLLDALEAYALENHLNVTATCNYASGQLAKKKQG